MDETADESKKSGICREIESYRGKPIGGDYHEVDKLSLGESKKLGFAREVEDYRGKKFNKLEVIGDCERDENSYHRYLVVQCECGSAPFRVRRDNLTQGRTQSCGCLSLERINKNRQLVNNPTGYTQMSN